MALLLDLFILGALGITSGIFLFDTYARLGGWGRLVGFFVALAYFGLLNSKFGKGQTLGKRLMKIEVVDHSGKSIALSRSILRYTVLGIPYFLNGATTPPDSVTSPFWMYLIAFIVFGCAGAIIYLYIFNRRTRQSLHDLIAGTFVVRATPEGALSNAKVWNGHLVVVGAWFIAVIGLLSFTSQIVQQGAFPELLTIQKSILMSGKAHAAGVTMGKAQGVTNGTKWEKTILRADVDLKESPADYAAEAEYIASVILSQSTMVHEKDILAVKLKYGYDIGIAYFTRSMTAEHSPKEWEAKLSK